MILVVGVSVGGGDGRVVVSCHDAHAHSGPAPKSVWDGAGLAVRVVIHDVVLVLVFVGIRSWEACKGTVQLQYWNHPYHTTVLFGKNHTADCLFVWHSDDKYYDVRERRCSHYGDPNDDDMKEKRSKQR